MLLNARPLSIPDIQPLEIRRPVRHRWGVCNEGRRHLRRVGKVWREVVHIGMELRMASLKGLKFGI